MLLFFFLQANSVQVCLIFLASSVLRSWILLCHKRTAGKRETCHYSALFTCVHICLEIVYNSLTNLWGNACSSDISGKYFRAVFLMSCLLSVILYHWFFGRVRDFNACHGGIRSSGSFPPDGALIWAQHLGLQ